MAESDKASSLSQDYLLKDKEEKVDVVTETVEKTAEKDVVEAAPETPVTENVVESSAPEAVTETAPESVDATAEENAVATDDSDKAGTEAPPADSEESDEKADEGNAADDETPEIKLETAPGDYRFPTTNQSRHCFTRYVEYHRCVAAKGEDASECDKFAKYYRSLCPGEWVDKWNEQRENGTFPGPL